MRIFNKDDYINNQIISSSQKKFCGSMAPHGHDFFELEFIVDGHGTYIIDGKEYEIKKNTLFFMSPAHIHSLKNVEATLINVMFSHEYSKETLYITVPMIDSPYFLFRSDDGILIHALLNELVKVNESDTSYAMLLIHCIMSKLYHHQQPMGNQPALYVRKSIIYMLENFQKGITLKEIGNYLGLSSAYFSNLFRSQTGINFKSYLDNIRFSYAKKLLALTPLSVQEVYCRSGFSDYTNFVRRFKQKYQMTPTEYRKKQSMQKASQIQR